MALGLFIFPRDLRQKLVVLALTLRLLNLNPLTFCRLGVLATRVDGSLDHRGDIPRPHRDPPRSPTPPRRPRAQGELPPAQRDKVPTKLATPRGPRGTALWHRSGFTPGLNQLRGRGAGGSRVQTELQPLQTPQWRPSRGTEKTRSGPSSIPCCSRLWPAIHTPFLHPAHPSGPLTCGSAGEGATGHQAAGIGPKRCGQKWGKGHSSPGRGWKVEKTQG